MAVATLTGVLMMIAAAAVVTTFVPEALRSFAPENRRTMAIDAMAALGAAIGLGLMVYRFHGLMLDLFHAQALPEISAPELIASRAPALSAMASGVRSWLMNAAGLALAALLAIKAMKRRLIVPVVLVVAAAMLPGDVRTPGEFAVHYVSALVSLGAVVAFCRWFARRNWLAYGVVLWVAALRSPLAQLFGNGNASLEAQGWIVAVVLGVSLLWAIAPAFWRPRAAAE